MVERYAEPLKALREALPKHPAGWQSRCVAGGPGAVAAAGRSGRVGPGQLAALPYLTYGLDIIEVALERKLAPSPTSAQVYFALSRRAAHQVADGQRREACRSMAAGMRRPAACLRDELQSQQRALVGTGAGFGGVRHQARLLVRKWLARDDSTLQIHPEHVQRHAQPARHGLSRRCRSRCGGWRSWPRRTDAGSHESAAPASAGCGNAWVPKDG